jgi:hypothetical protein
MEVYDEEFYKREYNKKSAIEFIKYTRDVERLISKKDWNLEIKFNKHYCGFKAGFFNAFGIQWIGTKTFALFFKVSEAEAMSTNLTMTKYEPQWKQAVFYVEPGKTKIEDYESLFELAYKKLTGS